ncbi:hypothetical protein COOONC_26728, partial [Cooperia oncophora]
EIRRCSFFKKGHHTACSPWFVNTFTASHHPGGRLFQNTTMKFYWEIERCYENNSSATSVDVVNRLKTRGIIVSTAHIKRLRRRLGFKKTTTKYCHTIRDTNKLARLDFCSEMLAAGVMFSDCVFTDECTVQRYCRLVQDNAPPHKSRYTSDKLRSWGVDTMAWPAESPDLNPIELVWGNMKICIRKQGVRSLNDLKVAIAKYWKTLTPEVCAKYVGGIRRRMERIVEQRGRNIIENK